MSDDSSSSKFWTFIALPLSLVLLASAYYIKVPAARQFIDAHTTIGQRFLGRFVAQSDGGTDPGATAPTDSASPGDHSAPGVPAPPVTSSPSGVAAEPPQPLGYDLQTLARDQSLWPKTVRLTKPSKFPAVLNDRVVGELQAPVGAEATLLAIKNGMLGLKYQGGGAWVTVDSTDLASRVPLR